MKYLFGIITLLLLTTSILLVAATTEGIKFAGITNETKGYLEDFIKKGGIKAENISNITELNLEELPGEINIENIEEVDLAIYEIGYEENTEQKQVFVITYSVGQLNSKGDLIIAHNKRQFLSFGYSGEMNESGFLKTSSGVETGAEKGYIMMREGSITGISTNLEILEIGQVEIIIYKNGQAVKFSNTINAQGEGIAKDYDLQSSGIVRFAPGDLISVYARTDETTIKDVITMVEITTTK